MSKSSITTEVEAILDNPSVGEILSEEFLTPLGLSQSRLAREISVPPRRINEIILGKRIVTADTDLRLCRYFSMSDGFFLRLQMAHELEAHKRSIRPVLDSIRPHQAA